MGVALAEVLEEGRGHIRMSSGLGDGIDSAGGPTRRRGRLHGQPGLVQGLSRRVGVSYSYRFGDAVNGAKLRWGTSVKEGFHARATRAPGEPHYRPRKWSSPRTLIQVYELKAGEVDVGTPHSRSRSWRAGSCGRWWGRQIGRETPFHWGSSHAEAADEGHSKSCLAGAGGGLLRQVRW
jgi:hypothetical protein